MQYKDNMTSLERVKAYNAGELVDRLPYGVNLGESIVSYYGYSNKDYLFSSEIMVDVEGKVLEEFGGDGITFSINTRAFAEALGSKMKYPEYGYSDVEQYRLSSAEDVDSLECINPYKDGRMPIILEAVKRAQERYGAEQPISITVPCPANCALGIIPMKKLVKYMIKDTDKFCKVMDYCFDSVLECAKIFYYETNVPIGTFEVMAAYQVTSLKQFQKYLGPYIKKTVEELAKLTGEVPSYGSCGSNAHIWEELISMGIKSIGVDATDDIACARNQIGDRTFISGNIDPVFLKEASQEEVGNNVYKCITQAADSPCGFKLGLGGGPAAFGTPIENIRAFSNYAREYGRGAQKGKNCLGTW